MKKAIVIALLICMTLLCLAGCSVNPTDEDKEENRQDLSQIQDETSGVVEEIKDDLSGEGQTSNYQAKAEEMSAFLLENVGVTTIQYTLMDGDEVILSNMVGVNEEWNKPVFCIASSSKMYVTAAVMMLVDQGKIDLDMPVVQYMPEFTMADERYKEITPRMLLNHSSGLYGTNMGYGNSSSLGSPSTVGRDVFFENKKVESLKANPGDIAVYCNDGFVMSELLVEKVSGMAYHDFIKNNISVPLGLTYTTTALDPALNADDITPAPGPDGNLLPVEYMNYPGTGGIYSTSEEMCQFARLFMGHYPEILSKESAEKTMELEFMRGYWVEEDIPNAMNYGLGWDDVTVEAISNYGIRALRKGGDASFHHADITVLPDYNISMAVLSSGGNSMLNAMVSSSVIVEYLNSKGIIDNIQEDNFEPTVPVKVEMPEELKKYEGFYGNGTTFARAVQVTINDGEMLVPGGFDGMLPDETYVYTGDGEFTSVDGMKIAYFKEEANGITYLIQRTYYAFPGLGYVIIEGHEFQKLEPQVLPEDVKIVWQAREGKQYFCVNETFNSSNYLDYTMLMFSPVIDLVNGYASGDKIVDANKAVNATQIPVMSGRDGFDLNFYESNGKNYLNKSGQIFLSEENIIPFEIADGKSIAIDAEGHSQWFSIDANTAGKEVKVTIPEKSSVFVYDENSVLSAYSMSSGEQDFSMPSSGFIVFVGGAGVEFKLV